MRFQTQPPLGGCVLKQPMNDNSPQVVSQPPLGGCVLKLCLIALRSLPNVPAAFRRLCVETAAVIFAGGSAGPAAFRRLCVETGFKGRKKSCRSSQPPLGGCVLKLSSLQGFRREVSPAAFRRLCVETAPYTPQGSNTPPAAFRRLCVETERI